MIMVGAWRHLWRHRANPGSVRPEIANPGASLGVFGGKSAASRPKNGMKLEIDQGEADLQCLVHLAHGRGFELTEPTHQTSLVNTPELIELDDCVSIKSAFAGGNQDLNGVEDLTNPRRDGRNDRGGTVFVADVVLQNESGARFFNLRALGWIKANDIDLAASGMG